jgi:SAM-dependent methyltransferase
VDDAPEDTAARQERLAEWARQQRRAQARADIPVRAKVANAARDPRGALHNVEDAIRRGSQRLANGVLDRGLDTAETANLPEHRHPERLLYVPSPWHVLPRALRYIGVSDRDTFVDFGCGKGRIVHQAAKRPFGRVIGVEISPVLADAARVALAEQAHKHRCPNVEIVVADATDYRVPDDLTVAFFFRPFIGQTLDTVLQGIIDSIDRQPRVVRIIYVYAEPLDQVLRTGRFRLLKEQRGGIRDIPQHRAAIFESC